MGYSYSKSRQGRGFLWFNDKMLDLRALRGGKYSHAWGINNSGQVVGNCDLGGCLWSNGTMTCLKRLLPKNSGWQISEAWDINNNGQIVGGGTITDPHAFLMTPVVDSCQ
ncbi:MAG: hypothetical protein AB4352_27590 [Hormoscilla sp.]